MVSVIVPIYNVADYLRQGLDSLRAQTFGDLEIIMVNDGSTDGSAAIAREYASADPRFKYFCQSNAGPSVARNTGLSHATGSYVAFFDSDDMLHPRALEIAMSAMTENGADIARFGFRQFTTDGDSQPQYSPADITARTSIFSSLGDIRSIALGLFSRPLDSRPYIHHGMSTWGGIYLRSIIDSNGITYNPDRRIFSEDAIFNFEYLQHVCKYLFIDLPLYQYRVNPESITRKPRAEWGSEILDTSVYIEKLISSHYPNHSDRLVGMGYAINSLRAHTKRIIESDLTGKEKGRLIKELVADRRLRRIYREYPRQRMPFLDRLHFRIMMTCNYPLLKYLTRIRSALGRLMGRQP